MELFLWADEAVFAVSLGFQYYNYEIEFLQWQQDQQLQSIGFIPLVQKDTVRNKFILGAINFGPGSISPTASGAIRLGTMTFRVDRSLDGISADIDTAFYYPAGKFALNVVQGGEIYPQYADCGQSEIVSGPRSCSGPYPCSDVDSSGQVNIGDIVFLINYLFGGGAAPGGSARGDANCSQRTDISDAVFLINYIFAGGAAPCLGCYESPQIDSLKTSVRLVDPSRSVNIVAYATEPTGAYLDYCFQIDGWRRCGFMRAAEWTAPSQVGQYICNVFVSDGCDTVSESIVVEVAAVSPEIMSFYADPEVLSPGGNTSLRYSLTDPNNDSLMHSVVVQGGTILEGDSTVEWTLPMEVGFYEATLTASDGEFSDTMKTYVEVTNSPIIDSVTTAPVFLSVGDTVEIKVYARDLVGRPLEYQLYAGQGEILQDGGSVARWVLPNYATFTYLELTVSNGVSSSSWFQYFEINEAPTRIY